jgi:hypothetical protein
MLVPVRPGDNLRVAFPSRTNQKDFLRFPPERAGRVFYF